MKKLLWAVLALAFLPSCYVTKQTYRQVGLFTSREPVSVAIESKDLSDAEKAKLRFSQSALAFARAEGLKVGTAYESYVKLPGRAVSYTVQAALPTEMSLKKWWFPVVGSVPYIGYFDEADRNEEAESLRKKGFEVYEGSATAFSSLGWFPDPIYSSMLRRSDVDLAQLYFHELTHRTVWLTGGVEFNENLAEFVGDTLTVKFFKSMAREKELAMIDQANDDDRLFRDWLKKLREAIEKDLKDSESLPVEERVARKNKIIELAISEKPNFKRIDFVGSAPWNNARILAAGLYVPDTSRFLRSWQCFLNARPQAAMGEFLKKLEVIAEKSGNGFQALDALCEFL